MGVYKVRQRASFRDGTTFVGSAGFSGQVSVNTAAVFGGPVTVTGSAGFTGLVAVSTGASFAGPLTVTGSAGFTGLVVVNTGITYQSTQTVFGTEVYSASPLYQVPPLFSSASATYQVAGRSTVLSGAISATVSTTALNSGSLIQLTPILRGAPVASHSNVGFFCISTIAPAGSGGYFSVGFVGTQVGLSAPLDFNWIIVNPG